MSSFEQYQKEQEAYRLAAEFGGELIECECGGTFFEQVCFEQYLANQPVIIGQRVPVRNGVPPFYMLRCALCGKLREPNIMRGVRDQVGQQYDKFLDSLDRSDKNTKER